MNLVDPMNLLAILLMAASPYMTRIGGYILLRGYPLGPRTRTVIETAPGCVLVTVIAPDFVTGRPADLITLAIAAAAATRLSVLPTVLIAIISAGILRGV